MTESRYNGDRREIDMNDQVSPAQQAAHLRDMLTALIEAARQNIGHISDPKAQALFEVTAEVAGGLRNAYDDYANKAPAWR
ncbi:hypothetical protein [Nocardia camponoti]|uniref:Uncharacterized protein n=1 Tax=Nocardia camponoti TaxID=1616106 RepID=A0A917QMZ3_9NOCA|nr:hypothetical protein [Nocardia camponoti]GGK59419.1 hypothetical protein GCM10011591_34480 [Nocardia camponoti]